MACLAYCVSATVFQVESQTAELSTLATVGATTETMVRGIACSRITYTQSSMHKHLKLGIRHSLVYLLYLVYRQLACQYHTAKPYACKPSCLVCRAIVCLSTCMQLRHSRSLHFGLGCYFFHHFHHSHVLHKDSIHASLYYVSQ